MIAISYRREDSQPVAGRLYDRLQARFGKQNVFMDFDSIPPGVDFREQIKRTIERSNLVIAVIGPRWLGEQADSSRRIDDPTDFVRLEIKYALEKGIPIIPLLVDNTMMPKPEKLPPELEALAFRNALPLDSGIDFHTHAERLINGICGLIDVSEMQKGHAWGAGTTRSKPAASLATPTDLTHRSNAPAWGVMALIAVVGVPLAWWFITGQSLKIAPQRTDGSTANPVIDVTPSPAFTIAVTRADAATYTLNGSAPVSPAAVENAVPQLTKVRSLSGEWSGIEHRDRFVSTEKEGKGDYVNYANVNCTLQVDANETHVTVNGRIHPVTHGGEGFVEFRHSFDPSVPDEDCLEVLSLKYPENQTLESVGVCTGKMELSHGVYLRAK